MRSLKSPEISDYIDYDTITQIRNILEIEKICLIIFRNLCHQRALKT